MLVNFIKGNPTDKEPLRTRVENMLVNGNMVNNTDRELTHTLTEISTLENGKKVNIMEKELTYMLTEINTLENGKKLNITNQTTNVDAMERVLIHMSTETNMLENGKKVYDMVKELLPMQTEKLKKVFGKKIN